MRKPLRIVLAFVALAVAVMAGRPIVFLGWVWLKDGSAPRVIPTAGTDDASRLSPNRPSEVIEVSVDPIAAEKQLVELVRRAGREGRHISISGARHSMGGHTLYPDGIAVEMHGFNHLSLDAGKRLLTAGAGARWFEIIPYLDERGYSVSVMQANNDFSVGGSLSVNCHGWQNDLPPIVGTVESFRVLTASGEIKRCSRTENRELFSLVLGGYGLFGLMLEVDLRVVPNDYYAAEAHVVDPPDYVRAYHDLTRGHADVGMAYGRISVAPDSFLQEASVTLLRRKTTDRPASRTLVDENPSLLKRLVFRGGVNSDYGKNLRWWLEKKVGQTGGVTLSRNQILNEPSHLYATCDPASIDILHEYFIPAARFADFIHQVRPVLLKHRPQLLNITVRNVKPDQDTFLRYAPTEMFGLVLLFHQRRDPAEETAMRALTRDLIDVAIACGGRYYLPYRPHATVEQFNRAYPEAGEFFALKRRYDPQGIFENQFYLNYGPPLVKSPAGIQQD
jgi:FAD/FMN-containing dehydrogenase